MAHPDALDIIIPQEDAGLRLDVYISRRVTDCTRSYAAKLIRRGYIRVDGLATKPSYKLKFHEHLTLRLPEPQPVALVPEPIQLDILFEDRHLIVVNKPAGLVVHPAAGHASGTLVNGILYHCPDLAGIGGELRPGIVHRLDKDTSGIIVVAKSSVALEGMARQFKARSVEKWYIALVYGIPDKESGAIELPVGRHPVDRKKMSTISPRGRQALTLWRVKEKLSGVAVLEVELKTGRTHQIRVHCESMGHPIVGDSVYGSRKKLSQLAKTTPGPYRVVINAQRQMLHACRIGFSHPITGNQCHFEASLPRDMAGVMEALRNVS